VSATAIRAAAGVVLDVPLLLRAEGAYAVGAARVPWARLAIVGVVAGLGYGAVMGSYDGRPLQILYSALKVPMLFLVSALVCLPSYYVLNALLGLSEDFPDAIRGILASQATPACCLLSLAPVTGVAYASIEDYEAAKLWNGLPFALATLMGQVMLARHYRPLIARNRRHAIGMASWLVAYVFVAIQMAWVLRPFVGAPGLPTQFFRDEAWTNAYQQTLRAIGEVMWGR